MKEQKGSPISDSNFAWWISRDSPERLFPPKSPDFPNQAKIDFLRMYWKKRCIEKQMCKPAQRHMAGRPGQNMK
jgi:hypothetical protein